MEFTFEYWARGDSVHGYMEVVGWSRDDAEDRVAVWLRDRHGEDWRLVGLRGTSPLCLFC